MQAEPGPPLDRDQEKSGFKGAVGSGRCWNYPD